MDPETQLILRIASGGTLSIAVLCSLPAVSGLLAGRSEKPRPIYEDEDGKSTLEETARFSNKLPKTVVVVFALLGCLSSIFLSVQETLSGPRQPGMIVDSWLYTGTWLLLGFNAICVASTRRSTRAFRLGVFTSLTTFVLLIATLHRESVKVILVLGVNAVEIPLRIVFLASTIGLAVSAASLPRRPAIYKDGRAVDRYRSVSALKRFTFTWAYPTMRALRKNENMTLEKYPVLSHHCRSDEQERAWKRHNIDKLPLWRGLLWTFRKPVAVQWTMSACKGITGFAPQWWTLRFLQAIERGMREQHWPVDIWFVVAAMVVSIIIDSTFESWMFWICWGELMVPVRSQLASIIFDKAMKRKNVKAAKKKEEKATTSEGAGGENGTQEQEPTETTPLNGKKDDAKKTDKKEGGDDNDDEDQEDATEVKSRQAVINLIGVDASRISMFTAFQFIIPQSVGRLVVSLLFLIYLLGLIPMLAGLAAWALILPVNMHFTKVYTRSQDKMMKVRDQKLEVVNECLQGARQIKFAGLEAQWEKKIDDMRAKELAALWRVMIGDTWLFGCWTITPIFQSAAALSTYAILHGELTPAVAFIGVSIFKSLEMALTVLPEIITDTIDAWVSCKRIQKFLDGPEITPVVTDGPEVAFKNASVAWPVDAETADEDRFVLRRINVAFPMGELSVISGKTGSGKSLILSALIGEADLLEGAVTAPAPPSWQNRFDYKANRDNWILPGARAYVAQVPWIENASLKDNVLFGLPFDEERYNKTLDACALRKDLDILTDGDLTELGTNGINLSGGQKWRVTLARAVYSRAGILIFDDIFSAVDAHVGRHIFEECLTGELCEGRTRILVTHHVALCAPKTKYLVELGDGTVQLAGFVDDLEEDGTLEAIKSHEQSQVEIDEDENATAASSEDTLDGGGENAPPLQPLKRVQSNKKPAKYIEDEEREKGAVKLSVYSAYFQASGGYLAWLLAAFIFVLTTALNVGRSYWLMKWTEPHDQSVYSAQAAHHSSVLAVQTAPERSMFFPSSDDEVNKMTFRAAKKGQNDDLYFYLGIFVALSAANAVFGVFRTFYSFWLSFKASKKLFKAMAHVVLRTPLRWLDTVPVGRILNRFTADFNTVDSSLDTSIMMMMMASLGVVGICVATNFGSPYIIIPAVPLILGAIMTGNVYIRGARPSKRLESTAKSPVFDLFGSSLAGLSTIRGFDKMPTYLTRMHEKLNSYSAATYHIWLFNRWMGFWMLIMGVCFTGCAAVLVLLSDHMTAALAGFTMAFALEFSQWIQFTVRIYTNMELDMNALERVLEYTKLPMEDQGGEKPPAAWPTEGRLEVTDLVVGYAPDLPAVLKGLSFSVNPRERIGVVGRTGAGKSSLTLALFRFIEPSGGNIFIDGLDICKMNLHDLRSRLAIIPQDPVLFSGTIRSNLDPFDDRTDAELKDCLARVHLLDDSDSTQAASSSSGTSTPAKNTNVFHDLASPISEGGGNLSQGQRQLLCLARAIVSRPKIMVLDEATSAVDMHTDTLIQRSIREEFGDSTLLVIAHRLSTIADFDRILVLSDGQVEEFGTPRDLWSAGGGFRSMCDQSGEKEKLRSIIFGEETKG